MLIWLTKTSETHTCLCYTTQTFTASLAFKSTPARLGCDENTKGWTRGSLVRLTWTTCCCLGMVWSDTLKHRGSFRDSTSSRLQH